MRDLGSLKNCLVEGEEGAGLRSPRRRRVALLLATLLQFTVLSALILIPLLVRGERLQPTWLAPGPICGLPEPPQNPRPENSRPTGHRPIFDGSGPIVQPPTIPDKIGDLNDANAASSVPVVGTGGPYIPGTFPVWDPLATHGRPPIPEPPRPAPAAGPKIAVSEGVQEARLIRRVQPLYPALAVQTRQQGTVVLRALIGTDGAVREVQLVSGPYLLARAAMDAVLQWRYQPTLLNGQPVEVETRITVIFTLNR